MGPVQVTVKTDCLHSKFPNKPDYLVLTIDGEDYNYTVENPDCAAFFEGQRGRVFTLVAEGSRENATLTYVGEAAPDPDADTEYAPAKPPAKKTNRPPASPPASKKAAAPPQQQQHAPPAQEAASSQRATRPAAETPEERLHRVKVHANRVANCWVVAFAAAAYARDQIKRQLNLEVSSDQFQGCVSSVFIQMSRDGMVPLLPTGAVDADGFYAAPVDVAPRRPVAEPQPSDNDGENV
jgi:hypothetical protein